MEAEPDRIVADGQLTMSDAIEQNAVSCRALLTSQYPYSSAQPRNSAGACAVDF